MGLFDNKRYYQYNIRPEHLDFTRRVTMKSIFDILLDAACVDAEHNGFGSQDIMDQYNVTWVLLRMRIDIHTQPVEGDTLTVYTWVGELSKLSTTRNFQVVDQNGNLVVTSTTLWTLIDLDSRRMAPIETVVSYKSIAQPENGQATDSPARLKSPVSEKQYNYTVLYSDIDINRHAHSTNYLRWAVDTLPLDLFEKKGVTSLELNFLREAYFGDRIEIDRNDSNPYQFELKSGGEPSCRIQITFPQ